MSQVSAHSVPFLARVSPELVPELKSYNDRHRGAVVHMIEVGDDAAGLPAAERFSKAFDGLLSALFHAAHAAMLREKIWWPVSLAAVGSYGRGEVSLHSDLDVRLICARDPRRAAPVAEALLYPLWDSGLVVGHQVVTADDVIELARTDLPTATSLLDWRHIVGDPKDSAAMLARAFEGVFGGGNLTTFLTELGNQAALRETKYGGSVYLLEPDVKNGAGGLRDLDIALWAARARWRVQSLADLVRAGVLAPRELEPITTARSFMWRVRNLLHLSAGRRADRLGFEQQEKVAQTLGYGNKGPHIERFMSDYYRHARAAARARDALLHRAMPPPRRKPVERKLGAGLKTTNGAISFMDRAELDRDPAIALRLYDEAVRRDLPVYEFARDAVGRVAITPEWAEKLRASDEAAQLFVRLCTRPQTTKLRYGSAVQELHDVGLLLGMIPEFAPVVGRVHHDVYHVYTVDAHSLAAVDRLAGLCRGDLAAEFPLACRLAAEITRPVVLFFATLLHDIGKDTGGKNHSQRGRELSRVVLGRLGLSADVIDAVGHLVENHLRMYHMATRRDIDDPRTLEEFCAGVEGTEGLRELYLLTVADVSTTSPTAFTSWKARMLDDLYTAAEGYLVGGGAARAEGPHADGLRQAVRDRWKGDRAVIDQFLSAMPVRYLYANDPAAMAEHARIVTESVHETAAVRVMAIDEPYVELGVTSEDRPGLLALITAAFAASRYKVVGGQIYSFTAPDGRARALDMFWVRAGRESSNVARSVDRVEKDLRRLLSGEVDVEELVPKPRAAHAWTDRASPAISTRVSVDNRCATDHTVIEVTTRDRVGLLHALASALTSVGLTIDLAKINTEGDRVADVFYVTDASGTKVTDEEWVEAIQRTILERLMAMDPAGENRGADEERERET